MRHLFQEWWHVVGNPGHALAELTYFGVEITFEFLVGRKLLRWYVDRHDREVHGKRSFNKGE